MKKKILSITLVIAVWFAMPVLADGRLPDIPWVLEPVYHSAGLFYEGLAPVLVHVEETNELLWGYIDKNGNMVIGPQFVTASNFYDGLAAVSVGLGWEYIDGGPFRRRIGTSSGFIDREGNVVVDLRFDQVRGFSNGLAAVMVDWLWGFVDSAGNVVIEPQFTDVVDFSEGLAAVRVWEANEGLWGFIDTTGNMVIEPRFIFASHGFSDGLAAMAYGYNPVTNLALWGYIDMAGNMVIEPRFEIMPWPFQEGLASIVKVIDTEFGEQHLWGVINIYGDVIIEPQFHFIAAFSDGLARIDAFLDFTLTRTPDDMWHISVKSQYDVFGNFVEGFEMTVRWLAAFVTASTAFPGVQVTGLDYTTLPLELWRFGFVDRCGNMFADSPSGWSGCIFGLLPDERRDLSIVPAVDPASRLLPTPRVGFVDPVVTPFPWRLEPVSANASSSPLNLTTASTWAHEGIARAIALELVPANLQNNYNQAVTRAEFTALAVALYENMRGEITGRVLFSDTNDIYVQKMAYLGVVTGVSENRFDPNANLTREQAAVMLSRLANAIGQPLMPSAPAFADNNKISSWAFYGVGQMQMSGIMSGIDDNRFDPQGAYTREQSIITILRLFDILY